MDLLYVKGKCNKQELIMTVLVPVLLGVLSFLLVKNHMGIYMELSRNRVFPPIAIFPVIWFLALIMMGIASYRIKILAPSSVSHIFFAAQLLSAFIWNVTLLRFEKLNIAFILIIVYLIFLAATFFEYEKIDKKSGYLMAPALVWAVVLAVANFFLCRIAGSV